MVQEFWKTRPLGEELDALIAARRADVGPASPEKVVTVDRLMHEAMAEMLGDKWPGMLATPLEARADVSTATEKIIARIGAGHANGTLLDQWREHLAAEDTPTDKSKATYHQIRWFGASARLQALMARVNVVVVPSIGPHLAAATFVGPRTTCIVIGKDAFFDSIEAEFLVYHMYLHSLGDVSSAGFGCWLEYKHHVLSLDPDLGVEPLQFWAIEDNLNDRATCLLYDAYTDQRMMVSSDPGLLQFACARQVAAERASGRPLAAIGGELLMRSMAVFGRLPSGVRPKLRFLEHLAVVSEFGTSQHYLIWRHADGSRWRLRIPSKKVFNSLGLAEGDVLRVGQSDLAKYRYAGLLIDPEYVREVRTVLRSLAVCQIPLRRPSSNRASKDIPVAAPVFQYLTKPHALHYSEPA